MVPGVVSYAGQSVGEGDRSFAGPVDVDCFSASAGQMIEPVDNERVEAEQAWLDTQDSVAASSTSRFQSQVLPHFFKSDFDIPATDECFDDAFDAHANLSAEEVLVSMTASQITHMNPAQLDETLSLAIPVPGTGNDLYSACASAVPLDCQPLPGDT